MKKLVKNSNWFKEIKYELKDNNKSVEDIRFVSDSNGWCTWQEFLNMRIVKNWWDNINWTIVGDNWYIDHDEYAGNFFWVLHRMPKKPLKKLNVKLKIYN